MIIDLNVHPVRDPRQYRIDLHSNEIQGELEPFLRLVRVLAFFSCRQNYARSDRPEAKV